MRGYIGFDPSPRSIFLKTSLEREFAVNVSPYSTLESVLKVIDVKLVD
jgi:hypothetical protein